MNKHEQFREQLQIFLGNDPHSVEVQKIAHVLEEAFLSLSPYLTSEDLANWVTFMSNARLSIAKHLAGHLEETVKEVNHAKNN